MRSGSTPHKRRPYISRLLVAETKGCIPATLISAQIRLSRFPLRENEPPPALPSRSTASHTSWSATAVSYRQNASPLDHRHVFLGIGPRIHVSASRRDEQFRRANLSAGLSDLHVRDRRLPLLRVRREFDVALGQRLHELFQCRHTHSENREGQNRHHERREGGAEMRQTIKTARLPPFPLHT